MLLLPSIALKGSPSDCTVRSLSAVLVSRFMLDLQTAKNNSCGMVSTGASQVKSIVFERALGSLAASLFARGAGDEEETGHTSTKRSGMGESEEGDGSKTSEDEVAGGY